jgi:PDDEXK-like domain of unknown function (DUF3799)
MNLAEAHARQALLALPVGLHEGVPEVVYHARVLGFASKSVTDLILRSPARYRAWVEATVPETPRAWFGLGKAIHMALLEPERFASMYVIEPDFGDLRAVDGRTTKEQGKANKLRREEWRAGLAPGATILDSEEARTTLGMVKAAVANPKVRDILRDGRSEVTGVWVDAATGVRCKIRVDLWCPDIFTAVDWKSTQDARRSAFARSVALYRYGHQEAMYRRGLRALGFPDVRFRFSAQEKDGAYDFKVYRLDSEYVAECDEDISLGLETMAKCLETDTWPGYPVDLDEELDAPVWARKSYR